MDTNKKSNAWLKIMPAIALTICLLAAHTGCSSLRKANTTDKETIPGKVFEVVDVLPEFPGGIDSLMKFIGENLNYPIESAQKGIQGRVLVKFVVKDDGTVTNAQIAEGVDPALDKEAIRVIEAMPKWKPGTKDGKPVDVWFSIPINFALKKNAPPAIALR
ncbi:MAG: energy transducer TonB [Tannerella sp.]|jgi:TonB family protein|nr:energy transducer TonB [Tannerella sp.]